MKAGTNFHYQLKGFKSTYMFHIKKMNVVQHWIRNAETKNKDTFSLTAKELNGMIFFRLERFIFIFHVFVSVT